MVDNINTNTMVGKVVAVCIALLFIVVLAFPIANSLGNMGKEDDGGGTGPITYTNTGDYYYKSTANDNTVHTVQLFEEWENLTETSGTDTISLIIDDSMIYSVTSTWDDDTSTDSLPVIIPIGLGSEDIFAVSPAEFLFYEINSMNILTPDIKVISSDDESSSLQTPTYPNSGSEECSFTVQNGVITYINNNDETVTSEYHMDYLYSTDNSGEYVLADTPFKTDRNSMIYVCDVGILDDSEHDMSWPALIYGSVNTSILTSSPVSVPLQFYGGEGTIQTAVTSTNDNGMITVSKIESEITMTIPDREGTYYVTDTVSLKAIVPTTVTIDPSAPVEVTVTNSGQTYKELDDGLYTVTTSVISDSEQAVLINDVEVATIPYDEYETQNYPVLCVAFGQDVSMWINSRGGFVSIFPNGLAWEQGNYIYEHLWRPRPGTDFVMDYIISNDGDYVYCTDSAKCLNTDNLYIHDCAYDGISNTVYGYMSYGTPSQIVSNLESTQDEIISKQMHSTDNGNYTTITDIDVVSTNDGDGQTPYSHTINGFFVPKTFTYTESSDSGSGSDSNGLGGIASTLVKLVPILLIIGVLLIFVMPMINKPS